MKINPDLLIDSKINGTLYAGDFKCKNIIKFPNVSTSLNNQLSVSIIDDVITFNGVSPWLATISRCLDVQLEPGVYTLTIYPISGAWTNGLIGVSSRTLNDSQIVWQQINYDYEPKIARVTYTISNIESIKQIALYCTQGAIFNNYKFRIQLEKGETSTQYTKPISYNSPNIYSNYETQVGYWENGKPLYRRVITLRGQAQGSELSLFTDPINNIDEFIIKEGYYWNEGTGLSSYRIPINCAGINGIAYSCFVFYDSSRLWVRIGGGGGYYTVKVVVEYTKSTD